MSVVRLKRGEASKLFEDALHQDLEELRRRDKFFDEIARGAPYRMDGGDLVTEIPDIEIGGNDMEHCPDNPIIRNCERTGWLDGKEPKRIYCPICGREEPESFYKAKDGEILGCDWCVKIVDSYMAEEC